MSALDNILRQHLHLSDWCILAGYRGSIAHGMYVSNTDPTSIDDKDIMAVCVPPIEHYFGLSQFGSRGTKEHQIEQDGIMWDIVTYELRKFIGLLQQGNPNVLAMLWLEDGYYIKRTPVGDMLLSARDLFTGKHVYHSFSGYAHGQLHRMTHMAFEGYMGEKRKALVMKHGYDCKNAAHLVRLLRMGIEFLVEGRLHVKRQDAAQLLEIKRGEWTLEQVKAESDRLFARCEEAYLRSPLPNEPDRERVEQLCVSMVDGFFKQRKE